MYTDVHVQGVTLKIAVVGSYGVGMTMRLEKFPVPGETLAGGQFSAGPGGKGSNQAIGAARLGAEVSLLTAIGDDAYAEEALELWRREGVDASGVVIGARPTMVGFILVDPSGENRIVIAPGALDELSVDHVEDFRSTIARSEMVVISMEIPMVAVVAALRIAREEKTPSILNPAPASSLPSEAWELIDYLTPNQTEGQILMGLESSPHLSDAEIVTALKDRTNGTVLLTRGSEGSLLGVGSSLTSIPSFPPREVKDSTGAGDAFTAALAVGLCEGRPIESAAIFASAAGSHAVTVRGVIDALPMRSDIDALTGPMQ